jgi:hypothetical protein
MAKNQPSSGGTKTGCIGCSVLLLAIVTLNVLIPGCRQSWVDSWNKPSSSTSENTAPAAPKTPHPDLNVKTIGVSPHSTGDNKSWPCPATKGQFDAMTDALVKSDNEGYQAAVADGVALEPGTRVRILDRAGPLFTIVHLRILSGDDKGRSCWASADAEGFFEGGYP